MKTVPLKHPFCACVSESGGPTRLTVVPSQNIASVSVPVPYGHWSDKERESEQKNECENLGTINSLHVEESVPQMVAIIIFSLGYLTHNYRLIYLN